MKKPRLRATESAVKTERQDPMVIYQTEDFKNRSAILCGHAGSGAKPTVLAGRSARSRIDDHLRRLGVEDAARRPERLTLGLRAIRELTCTQSSAALLALAGRLGVGAGDLRLSLIVLASHALGGVGGEGK
jgi:hypothetical protein